MSFKQLLIGRDEPIIDPDIPIIDAHHHLFVRPALRYMFDDYLADAKAGHRIVASVYIETKAFARRDGPEMLQPLGEVEFANGVGAMAASGVFGNCHVCAGIVGYADLRSGASIAEYLDRAIELAPDRFKGVRQVSIEDPNDAPYQYIPVRPPSGLLKSPGFRPAFGELAKRGLSFDAAAFHHQMPEFAELADAFPDTTIVLNHIGHAMGMAMDDNRRADVFRAWAANLRDLARRPNVVCKVGGLGLPFWGFGLEHREGPIGYLELADTWKPYVETAIEAFGADRCMMESDYPIDSRSCGFVPLWNALKHIVRDCTSAEKAAMFNGTAARAYRLNLPAHLLA